MVHTALMLSLFLFYIVLEVLASAIRQEKIYTPTERGRKKGNCPCTGNVIVYRENVNRSTEKLPQLVV